MKILDDVKSVFKKPENDDDKKKRGRGLLWLALLLLIIAIIVVSISVPLSLSNNSANTSHAAKEGTGDGGSSSKVVYNITYVLDGGTNNESNPISYTEDTNTISLLDAEKFGYDFEGWYSDLEKTTQATSIPKGSTGDKTFYAKWSASLYTLNLHTNGGTINSGNVTSYTYGVGAILPQDITRDDYTFEGWYDNALFVGSAITTISTADSGDKEYYAKWKQLVYHWVDASHTQLYLGSYPQTEETDGAITSELNTLAGTLPTAENPQAWTDCEYYIEKSVQSFMWYQDIEYQGNKYRGVYFTQYRPLYYSVSSSASNSCQDDNGYQISIVYWFKFEPIKWNILSESNGDALLIADLIIDAQLFEPKNSYWEQYEHNGGVGYGNNYEFSQIRAWLKNNFYNTSFNELEKGIIKITEVDNSKETTGDSSNSYACENTLDNVFLLSYVDMGNADYGFDSNTARQATGTDYAKVQGLQINSNTYSIWWNRSPNYCNATGGSYADANGNLGYNYDVGYTYGVRPCLWIRL